MIFFTCMAFAGSRLCGQRQACPWMGNTLQMSFTYYFITDAYIPSIKLLNRDCLNSTSRDCNPSAPPIRP